MSKRPTISAASGKGRVLITGGHGYIGSGLSVQLAADGWDVTRLARPGSLLSSSGAHATSVVADVREPDVWLRTSADKDAIIHLAGQTSAYVANSDPIGDEAINVSPMIRLLETCRRQNWKPFIVFAGTVTVVGLADGLPAAEDQNYKPVTVYDLHKLMAEEYLKLYCRLGYAHGTTLRLANVYGPGPTSSSTDRGVLNKMIRKALAGQPLILYGTGEWLRDYIYLGDVVSAFAAALDHPDELGGRHWIVASGESWKMHDAFNLIADRVAHQTGYRVPVEHVAAPAELSPIEKRNFVADIGGFCSATGWQPRVLLKEGIDRTIAAFMTEKAGVG